MKRRRSPSDTTKTILIEVPIVITYRLERYNSVVHREEGLQPLELDDNLIKKVQLVTEREGVSIEEFVARLITETVAKRLAADETKLEHLRRITEQHQSNILTEVKLNGKIPWPEPQKDTRT